MLPDFLHLVCGIFSPVYNPGSVMSVKNILQNCRQTKKMTNKKIVNLSVVRLTIIAIIPVLVAPLQTDIDSARFDQGRKQYELVQQQSQLPKYGQCWVTAMVAIESGCRQLNDIVQTRMALAYLNCFLEVQGRPVYSCSEAAELKTCVQDMTDADKSSFATFFTHTQDICYFLQAQVWQEQTEDTINRLEVGSLQVAEQLESSHILQQDILSSQNLSLQNQEKLMNQALNLSDVINASSKTVHSLFADLKQSTLEQRQIIGDLFDRLSTLQTTILGEVSGFYSLFFYVLSMFICYLLTSTTRTSGARIWLFLIMTVDVVLEQTAMKWLAQILSLYDTDVAEHEQLYWLQRQCRHVSTVLALLVLAVCVFMYQDISAINNRLLVEIRKQNSDLLRFVKGNTGSLTEQTRNVTSSREDSTDSDYTSDNMENDNSDSGSDKTFILPENQEVSDIDSHKTDDVSETDQMSMLNELYDLQREREDADEDIETWLNNSFASERSDMAVTPNMSYNLRPRRGGQTANISPAAQVESARSFSRTVRQMQQITEKNSRLIRACQQQNWQPGQRADSNHTIASSSRAAQASSRAQMHYGNDSDKNNVIARTSRASFMK